VVQNVAAVAALESATLARRTAIARAADAIARLAGTPAFALAHAVGFGAWLLVNLDLVPGLAPFDPFPFGLLTLVVSLEAIFLSIFALMSQNRLTRQSERRAHLDLQINLLTEQEATRSFDLIQRIADRLGVPRAQAAGDGELAKPTRIEDVVRTLERTLPPE
jgi:uncharacterized membrane protein